MDFPTKMRAHVALASADVERSIGFYRELLGQEPSKVREGYAKFEVAEPPLNLTLNYSPAPIRQASPAHFGVQVKSTGEVMTKLAAMNRAGFPARTEEGVGCCFAVQVRIARNALVDRFRRARPSEPLPELAEPEPESESHREAILGAYLRNQIPSLPEPYRAALTLTELDGRSQREAAEQDIGVGARTVLVDMGGWRAPRRTSAVLHTPRTVSGAPEGPLSRAETRSPYRGWEHVR